MCLIKFDICENVLVVGIIVLVTVIIIIDDSTVQLNSGCMGPGLYWWLAYVRNHKQVTSHLLYRQGEPHTAHSFSITWVSHVHWCGGFDFSTYLGCVQLLAIVDKLSTILHSLGQNVDRLSTTADDLGRSSSPVRCHHDQFIWSQTCHHFRIFFLYSSSPMSTFTIAQTGIFIQWMMVWQKPNNLGYLPILLMSDILIDKLLTIAVLVHWWMRMRGIDKLLAIWRQQNVSLLCV